MNNRTRFFTLILFLSLIGVSCRTVTSNFHTHYTYEYRGRISFYWKADDSKLDKLSDQLAKGSIDTCFIYCHARVFKNLKFIIDSVSHECTHDKKLNQKILDKFGENLKPTIIDTVGTKIAFEPYVCIIPISLEVGGKKSGNKKIIRWGYSRKLK